MKTRSYSARLSAAIAAALISAGSGSNIAHARDLTWDANDVTPPLGQDGSGGWDTSTQSWVDGDLVTGTNTTWNNANPDSAIFGNATTAFVGTSTPNNIELLAPLTVQNITFGTAADGSIYNISDFSGGSITLNGNLTKTAGGGQSQILLVSHELTLAAGDHVVAMKDSPGDVAEMSINGALGGAGGLTIDNTAASTEAWGTLALNVDSTYTGATNINNGRLVITTSGGLGATSAGTTISDRGTLSIGGAGTTVVGGLTLTEPITIKRNTYSGGEFGRYTAAVIVNNNGPAQTHTISGPLVVDSTDARIQVNTNTLVISSNITEGPDVTPGTGVLTLDGDFAGFVNLTGNNTGIGGGGIKLIGGVELNVTNQNNLGGPTAPITFAGNATLHPVGGFMTSFGSHPVNQTTFSGGLDIDSGQSFTVDIPLGDASNPVGSIGKRGLGTLNLNSTINLRGGQTFWDSGIVNVNAPVTLASLHLRSPVVNIGTGGSVTTTAGFDSFGADSTGTNGGPDIAVVNLTGTGQLIETTGDDFNISDNANTKGTINVSDNAVLTTGGITFLGKSAGAVGTINQFGGTVNINRTGNFSLVLADGRFSNGPTGNYNMTGGILNVAGEMYVGEGHTATARGTGSFTMSAGTANLHNWFVVGREGGVGTVDISGGTVNHTGGNTSIGDSAGGTDMMTLRGTAKYISTVGEFWVGTGTGSVGTVIVKDNAVLSVTDWFPVGRGGTLGTLDISGNASVTKSGGNNSYVGESTNAVTSTMTVRGNSSFTATTGEFWVGQGGGTGILNIQDSGQFTVNNWLALGRANGASVGTINLSGGTLTKQGPNFLAVGSGGTGTLNQTGGTLNSSGTRLGEASSGTMNLSGGTSNFTGEFSLGFNGGLIGTLNISNTANVTVPGVIFGVNAANAAFGGALNLNGGTLTGASFTAGASATALRKFTFNGGTLKPSADSTNFIGAKVTSVVSTGGALIDSNNHAITVNSALTHDSSLGGADGGLTKSGPGTVTLAAANTYTGGTTVSAGTLVAANADALAAGSLSVANAATAQLQASLPKAATISTLSTTGTGKLDITNNSMVIRNMTVPAVQALVKSGFASGAWTGPGIDSSSAAATTINAIGFASNGVLNKTDFKGVSPLTANDVLVKYTYYGDADLSGATTLDDFTLFLNGYQTGGTTWVQGDFDYSGTVTLDDFTLFLGGYQNQGAPLSALEAAINAVPMSSSERQAMLAAVEAVPEPTGLGLLGLAGIGALARRRRRGRISTNDASCVCH